MVSRSNAGSGAAQAGGSDGERRPQGAKQNARVIQKMWQTGGVQGILTVQLHQSASFRTAPPPQKS